MYPHYADCPHPHLRVSAFFPQFCFFFGNASSQVNSAATQVAAPVK
jgi:hypothetical protein